MRTSTTHALLLAATCSLLLSACGGGGGSSGSTPPSATKPNGTPTIAASPKSFNLESGKTLQVAVSTSDDDGSPIVSISNASTNLDASLSSDGKTLTVTAKSVTANEQGVVTLVAVENHTEKKQASEQISVNLTPTVNIFAFANGSRQTQSLDIAYAKPVTFRIVDDGNNDIPFSSVLSKDPSVVSVQNTASTFTLTAVKTGSTTVEVQGQTSAGMPYTKVFDVKSTGNQRPGLSIAPANVTLPSKVVGVVTTTITDPDGSSFASGTLSAQSADASIATARVDENRNVSISALKDGQTSIIVTLQDGEFTVSASIGLTVFTPALPELTTNNNTSMTMEEYSEITVPLDVRGENAELFKPSVVIEKHTQDAPDIKYSVSGNALTIQTLALKSGQSAVHYVVKATATDGKQTITAGSIGLMVVGRMNSTPIFELPNVVDGAVMIPKTGGSIKITVNDDDAGRVLITQKEWLNSSKAGTYTASYDDQTRTLKVDMSGFEVNEEFGVLMPYTDGSLRGTFTILFRTYELSQTDIEVLEMRKDAIARNEAARSYRLIAKMYAEHLENIGLVDAQYVDELFDELQSDDVNSHHAWLEGAIDMALKDVYRGNYNNGKAKAADTKWTFENYYKLAAELNKSAISIINELAQKSNGKFPTLTFETEMSLIEPMHYSKFYNKDAYGSVIDGKWEYAPSFKFLAAIDAKVKENTEKRVR